MRSEHDEIVRVIDLMLLERAERETLGLRLDITHRLWQPGTVCKGGEEVFEIVASYGSCEVSLPLSTKLRALVDYMARYKVAQTASQIAAGMNAHPFYKRHGSNAQGQVRFGCKVNRSSIKEQVSRVRIVIEDAFREFNIYINPFLFVQSVKTEKEVRYRLRAVASWKHLEH